MINFNSNILSDIGIIMLSDIEIIEKCNTLARKLYALMGYVGRHDYKFYEATHPQEILVWKMACLAFEELLNTDVENALCVLEEINNEKHD